MAETKTGKVKSIHQGFGFIREDEERDDYFFHKTELIGAEWEGISIGQQVEFIGKTETAGKNVGKLKAVDVVLKNENKNGGNENEI